jgi:hypothetical protein
MKKRKILEALKAAAKYFTTGAGAVSLVIGLLALAVIVPPFISIPIIVVVGLGFAYYGAQREWNNLDANEAKEDAQELERLQVKREQDEVLVISRNLDKRVGEIVDAERKIQLRLEEHAEHEQKHERELKLELERQQHDAALVPETQVSSKHSMPQQSVAHTREHHTAYRQQVTIRINNLPTFFTVDHHSPARMTVHASTPQEAAASQSSNKKNNACPQ